MWIRVHISKNPFQIDVIKTLYSYYASSDPPPNMFTIGENQSNDRKSKTQTRNYYNPSIQKILNTIYVASFIRILEITLIGVFAWYSVQRSQSTKINLM